MTAILPYAIAYITYRAVNAYPDVEGVSVYALGPPRREDLLLSLDPIGREEFPRLFAGARNDEAFLAAAAAVEGSLEEDDPLLSSMSSPFAPRFRIDQTELSGDEATDSFFKKRYRHRDEAWRKIDSEWLRTAEVLALRLNNEVNNTSLVAAIELPNTRRVVLFVGDAQRGNWVSWEDQTWTDRDGNRVTAKQLLGRTVLYKVGHHGSHNATLAGTNRSRYPNLNWMASGAFQDEFVAMIPANRPWAYQKAHWKHPLKSIEDALKVKADGRVFRTDVDRLRKPRGVTRADWQKFKNRTVETDMYFEYWIPD